MRRTGVPYEPQWQLDNQRGNGRKELELDVVEASMSRQQLLGEHVLNAVHAVV